MGNTLYDKPMNHDTAVKHLKSLQGQKHQQIACLCLMQNEKILWQSHETTTLDMRQLDDELIENMERILTLSRSKF